MTFFRKRKPLNTDANMVFSEFTIENSDNCHQIRFILMWHFKLQYLMGGLSCFRYIACSQGQGLEYKLQTLYTFYKYKLIINIKLMRWQFVFCVKLNSLIIGPFLEQDNDIQLQEGHCLKMLPRQNPAQCNSEPPQRSAEKPQQILYIDNVQGKRYTAIMLIRNKNSTKQRWWKISISNYSSV